MLEEAGAGPGVGVGAGVGVTVSVAVNVVGDAKYYESVFSDVLHECKHSAPGARLSARLRSALERYPHPHQLYYERMRPEQRRAVVSRTRDGCAPLFVAARRGNVELVEYLVHVCNADLEQRGVYEVPHDRSTHSVTPLWCAAVAGKLGAVRALADAGAQLDARSDSGSTALRSACFMTHVDVVRELLARGADVHLANHTGGTCLINAVQSAPLCALLLARGADVRATDVQLKTALHYAAQEHRLDTARLLLAHGACAAAADRAGDDALRTAANKGAAQIVALLLSHEPVEPPRAADALELLGATQLDEFNDASAALQAWRRATALRLAHHAPKAGHLEQAAALSAAALEGAREWQGLEELAAMAGDVDALRTQALLVATRVLGERHKDTVFRLMYRGAAHADTLRYQRCIALWSWALRVRIERDTVLHTDTCHTASALTRLMLDASAGRLERADELPRHRDVLRVFTLLADHLPECRAMLETRPVHKKQAETFDRALRCVTHLLHLLLHTAPDAAARAQLTRRAARLVAADVRSAHTGDSLLHLCASRLNVVRSTYFADEPRAPPVFPSPRVVRLLLRAGADARARNQARSTPLHVAAVPYNFSSELVAALLEGGAHLDQPNSFGDSAAELVPLHRGSRVCPLQHVTLACLAARALLASRRAVPPRALPATLRDFLDLHRA